MVIVQDDAFTARDAIVVCLITTDARELPGFRIAVDPTAKNGLNAGMVDKVTTVPKSRLGQRIGCLADDDLLWLDRDSGVVATTPDWSAGVGSSVQSWELCRQQASDASCLQNQSPLD